MGRARAHEHMCTMIRSSELSGRNSGYDNNNVFGEPRMNHTRIESDIQGNANSINQATPTGKALSIELNPQFRHYIYQ